MKAKAKEPDRRVRKKPVARKSSPSAATGKSWHGFRAIEMEWMNKHPEKLRPYAGEYVVVEGTKVVAHSADVGKAIDTAKRKGIKIPFVLFLEPAKPNTFHVGL